MEASRRHETLPGVVYVVCLFGIRRNWQCAPHNSPVCAPHPVPLPCTCSRFVCVCVCVSERYLVRNFVVGSWRRGVAGQSSAPDSQLARWPERSIAGCGASKLPKRAGLLRNLRQRAATKSWRRRLASAGPRALLALQPARAPAQPHRHRRRGPRPHRRLLMCRLCRSASSVVPQSTS